LPSFENFAEFLNFSEFWGKIAEFHNSKNLRYLEFWRKVVVSFENPEFFFGLSFEKRTKKPVISPTGAGGSY